MQGSGAPLLLTGPTLPTATAAYLEARPSITRAFLYGGVAAVSDRVAVDLSPLLQR